MATFKRTKSGGTQSEGASNSASPASSVALSNPGSTHNLNNNAPKYGTLVPNRIFVGGISSNTTEAELCQLFSKYGTVKATKIIADRAGVSKGYGFVTFESEEEVKFLIQDANNIVLKERRLNIAPAIKKQPFSRSFETSSPPPTTPNLYYSHNGVPYTFHNGMAFFPPTAHQPAIAAMPASSDPAAIYSPYGPAQNPPAPPYGTPVLLPAAPPMFMPPQNYSYQPMPMTNGAPQFIYPGSGSSNSSSGSPLAGTPDNPHMGPPMPPQYYPQQFPPQEAFYPQPIFISYNTFNNGEYEALEPPIPNDVLPQPQLLDRPYDRPVMSSGTSQRWANNPSSLNKQRLVYSKRPNGSGPNTGANNNSGSVRVPKKPPVINEGGESDVGGGGDAQPILMPPALTPPSTPSNAGNDYKEVEATTKMQSLSLGSSI